MAGIKGLIFNKGAIKKAFSAGVFAGLPIGMLLGMFLDSFLFWGVIALIGGGGAYWGYRKIRGKGTDPDRKKIKQKITKK